jgi:hypothetical protein
VRILPADALDAAPAGSLDEQRVSRAMNFERSMAEHVNHAGVGTVKVTAAPVAE